MEIKNMLPLEDQNLGKIKTAFLKCETLNGIMSYWKYFAHCKRILHILSLLFLPIRTASYSICSKFSECFKDSFFGRNFYLSKIINGIICPKKQLVAKFWPLKMYFCFYQNILIKILLNFEVSLHRSTKLIKSQSELSTQR
jgi:hypothetical protein